MPAPSGVVYAAAATIAANTGFLAQIDAAVGACSIKIRSSTDVLLATIPLADPAGTVDPATGVLTLSIAGPDSSAAATGTAAYGQLCDADGAVWMALPTQAGPAAVSGKLVLQTLSIVIGGTVVIYSAVLS